VSCDDVIGISGYLVRCASFHGGLLPATYPHSITFAVDKKL
jgi:hypothetical protein